jgi:hypothetical protein
VNAPAEVLAPNQSFPAPLRTNLLSVFWPTHVPENAVPPGGIWRADKIDKKVTRLATANLPNAIAVDGNFVYWVNGSPSATTGTIARVPINGGPTQTLLTTTKIGVSVAVDSFFVYAGLRDAFNNGSVVRVPKGGGAPVTVATITGGFAADMTASPAGIFWTENGTGRVRRLAPSGTVTTIATGSPSLRGIAVDEARVYWADSGPGTINSTPIGGGATTVLATGQLAPQYLAVDFCFVYWTDFAAGTVNRVNKQGGPTQVLATGQPFAVGIAVDLFHVYWDIFQPNGAVLRKFKF